jgi:hypothetical protein
VKLFVYIQGPVLLSAVKNHIIGTKVKRVVCIPYFPNIITSSIIWHKNMISNVLTLQEYSTKRANEVNF